MAANRNYTISIMKGIAIILMVAGHAEGPELMTNFIYTFHMPLFFMAAGYFFSLKHASEPWNFISRRFNGLYVPFIKWSLFFLVTHNIWHYFGILNETYGNWTGGVTHPYTWHSALQRLVMIFTSMSGYDEFMAGAFWFFRGLLVASILFLILFRLADSRFHLKPAATAGIVCLCAVAFTALRIYAGLKITGYPNGGWREVWGVFFFGLGFIFRQYEDRLPRRQGALAMVCFLLLCCAAWLHLSGMNNHGIPRDLWSLPLTGLAGWLAVRYVSMILDRKGGRLRDLLVFIGENTLYVFIFHIISFKAVSLAKIWWYDLDFGQIGCHMVIHFNHTDFFWVLYTIVGVALPLGVLYCVRRFRTAVSSRLVKYRDRYSLR